MSGWSKGCIKCSCPYELENTDKGLLCSDCIKEENAKPLNTSNDKAVIKDNVFQNNFFNFGKIK